MNIQNNNKVCQKIENPTQNSIKNRPVGGPICLVYLCEQFSSRRLSREFFSERFTKYLIIEEKKSLMGSFLVIYNRIYVLIAGYNRHYNLLVFD